MTSCSHQLRIVLFSVLLPLSLSLAAEDQATLGKRIYQNGVLSVKAVIGDGETEVDSTLMPCINCHGRDGEGIIEGGIVPSNITWQSLTRPYTVETANGRHRRAYDPELLSRAIRRGVDSSGNRLRQGMPRYRMDDPSMRALLAYLKTVGKDPDPGVGIERIQLGVVVSPSYAKLSQKPEIDLLRAYFGDINRNGGIYGRQVRVIMIDAARLRAGDAVLKDIFAVVGILHRDKVAMIRILKNARVPLLVLSPPSVYAATVSDKYIFRLLPNMEVAVSALQQHVEAGDQKKKCLILVSRRMIPESDWEAMPGQAMGLDAGESVDAQSYIEELVSTLYRKQRDSHIVFLGTSGQLLDFLSAAGRHRWHPRMLLYGPLLAGIDLKQIRQMNPNMVMALPQVPLTAQNPAFVRFLNFARRHRLQRHRLAKQLLFYSASQLVTSVLKSSGRRLTRDRFVKELKNIKKFETGIIPTIRFFGNRKYGVQGSFVLTLDDNRSEYISVGSRDLR